MCKAKQKRAVFNIIIIMTSPAELSDLHVNLRSDGITKRKNALKQLAELLQSGDFAKILDSRGGGSPPLAHHSNIRRRRRRRCRRLLVSTMFQRRLSPPN